MAISSSMPLDGLSQQAADMSLRFSASSFGKYLEQAREAATVTREPFIDIVNETIIKKNERLSLNERPLNEQIPVFSPRIYGNLERDERYPAFEELEPLYQALSQLLPEPFSRLERERYVALAQARLAERKKRPKKGHMPTAADWPALLTRLAAFDAHNASERAPQKNKVPYLLPVPSPDAPQIRLSTKVASLLHFNTSHVIERDQYVEEMMRLWNEEGKRLVVTKAMAGTGKTRAFYLLLKRIARMQNHWPFYYLLSSSSQTPDDHLDSLLSLLSADLQLSSEDERISREERMEQIFTELARCSKHGLRLAILVDDAHLLLDPSSGMISAAWQQFFDLWIAREHAAVLCLATREWPYWKGRDRSFLKEIDLEPLSPAAGAEIWKRFGFGDVSEELREAASRKCGGYPQWIELRASDLDEPGHHFLWPRNNKADYTSQSADNQHTKRIKEWLEGETIFDPFTDVGAREELTQVFTRELPYEAKQMLDLLVLAPLGIPLPLLQQEFDRPALALDDLKRCSLVDRVSFEQGRAALVSLAREARLHQLTKEQKEQIGQRVTDLYAAWLYNLQQYRDDAEQAELITELTILYLKHQQLLDASELVIGHGWLLHALGYAQRIAGVAAESARSFQQSVENEAGHLLLRLRLARYYRDWTASQSKQAYAQLYEMLSQGRVQFKPRTTLYIIHHKLRSLVRQKHYSEAHALVNEEYSRLEELQVSDPITYAELLDHRAYVAGRWGDYSAANGELERALQLRQEAVRIHLQCLEQFRRYEYVAPDLLKNHILYQKARILHDLSFYEKVIGDEKAIVHLEECLSLKDAGYSTKGSLALTYDDYASLLAPQGSYQKALFYTEHALQLTQQYMVEAKLDGALPQKGLLLINRGKLLLHLKRFNEARQHFEEGKNLVEGTSRHDLSFPAAERGLCSIEEQRRINPRGYLDHPWFTRYKEFAAYSDVKWLTPAGPLSKDEQQGCNLLMKQEGEAASNRLSQIIMESQKRELAVSFEEQREPRLQYLVPQEEIAEKLAGFAQLRREIETDETNVVVRRFYLDTIDERIHELEMIAAAGRQDSRVFWIQTQHLYALPDLHEMELSLLPLARDLRKGLQNGSTSDLARHILHQMQNCSIDPMSLLDESSQELEQVVEGQVKPIIQSRKHFSSEVAQRFFEDVFRRYQFAWTVVQDPVASHERVSLNEKQLILPKDEQISSTKIREILAHEVEGHAFRSVAGEKSRLQLLSLGLADFLKTDEGLATHYSQEAARFGTVQPNKTWIGTLTIGLAAGIICPPFSFSMLRSFLVNVFRLRSLLANGKKTKEQIEEEALKNAQRRCLRTFRGVSLLTQPGVCATKDCVYLRGYLTVSEKLHQEPATFERLLVGSVGLQQLDALTELGITKPHVSFQRLACDPNLESYIAQFS